MTDLHSRLLEELSRREAIAKAAAQFYDETHPWPTFAAPGFAFPRAHHFIALHDPADALRRYAHYRRIIERHQPVWDHEEQSWSCVSCGLLGLLTGPFACDDLADLADALGIAVDEVAS